jgi:hypothetical protein
MKRRFMVAMGIGFLISTVLMAVPSANGWAFLEFPGMGAANLYWGVARNSVIVGTAIGWAVNAIVYGLVALIIIRAARKVSN